MERVPSLGKVLRLRVLVAQPVLAYGILVAGFGLAASKRFVQTLKQQLTQDIVNRHAAMQAAVSYLMGIVMRLIASDTCEEVMLIIESTCSIRGLTS